MRIVSLDPGYDRLGVALIEKNAQGKEVLLFSVCHTSKKTDLFENRLFSVARAFREILETYKPDECALEKLFFQNNQKTAMFVSRVIGALTYVCLEKNIPIFEYTPLQIKTAVTGNGRSTKLDIMKMVPLIIECPKVVRGEKMLDDELDAIAVGITHLAMSRVLKNRLS
jgi:crossover junction endodeoxyribonuclease RuvC